MRPLCQALIIALLLLTACKQEHRTPMPTTPPTPSPSASNASKSGPPPKDWNALIAKVKNRKEREEKALNLLRDAEDARKQAMTLTDEAAKKAALKKVKDGLYAQAGNIYDELQFEADAIDKDLWKREFTSFQNKWDKLAKDLKRLGF